MGNVNFPWKSDFHETELNWIKKNQTTPKKPPEVELPAQTHRSMGLIIASKGKSQQIGVSAMRLHLY